MKIKIDERNIAEDITHIILNMKIPFVPPTIIIPISTEIIQDARTLDEYNIKIQGLVNDAISNNTNPMVSQWYKSNEEKRVGLEMSIDESTMSLMLHIKLFGGGLSEPWYDTLETY